MNALTGNGSREGYSGNKSQEGSVVVIRLEKAMDYLPGLLDMFSVTHTSSLPSSGEPPVLAVSRMGAVGL